MSVWIFKALCFRPSYSLAFWCWRDYIVGCFRISQAWVSGELAYLLYCYFWTMQIGPIASPSPASSSLVEPGWLNVVLSEQLNIVFCCCSVFVIVFAKTCVLCWHWCYSCITMSCAMCFLMIMLVQVCSLTWATICGSRQALMWLKNWPEYPTVPFFFSVLVFIVMLKACSLLMYCQWVYLTK